MKRMELAGLAVESSVGAPVVVLREHDDPHRVLPILIGGAEATAIALAAMGEEPPRPLTHDLLASVVRSLDGHLEAVEVTGLDEGTYVATLAITGPSGEQRIDARPSDAIALALRLMAPVFVSDAVLDEAGTFPEVQLDEASIDDAVEEFRTFLDDVDPSQFELERPAIEAGPDDEVIEDDPNDPEVIDDAEIVEQEIIEDGPNDPEVIDDAEIVEDEDEVGPDADGS